MTNITGTQPNAGYNYPPKGWKTNILVRVFSSVFTAVTLLFLISLACFAGTLIPQLKGYAFYAEKFPGYADTIYRLSLNDVYHSAWFITLSALLALNVAVCTFRRFFSRLKALKNINIEADEAFISGLPYKKAFKAECPGKCLELIRTLFLNSGYDFHASVSSKKIYGHGRAGRYSFLGEFFVHLSLLMIFSGAMAGNFYAFRKTAECYPGDIVPVPSGKYLALQNRIDELVERSIVTKKDLSRDIAELKILQRALPQKLFDIGIDGFRTEYIDTQTSGEIFVKNWYTTVSALDGTVPVYTATMSVNDPFYYKGVNIYQMSRGTGKGGFKNFSFAVNDNGNVRQVSVPLPGYEVAVSGTDIIVKLRKFEPDFTIAVMPDGGREVYSPSRRLGNPAAGIEVFRKGSPGVKSFIWSKIDPAEPEIESVPGVKIKFLDLIVETIEFTGIQIAYDPGAQIVWAGSALMMAGFAIAFYCRYRRLWFFIDGPAGVIIIAGSSDKDISAFASEFERMCALIESALND